MHKAIGGHGMLVAEHEEQYKQGKVRHYQDPLNSVLCVLDSCVRAQCFLTGVASFSSLHPATLALLKLSWRVALIGLTAKL